MAKNTYSKWDLFLWPYHVQNGNQIVLREDGEDYVVELDGGEDNNLLYAYDATSEHDPYMKSLYIEADRSLEAASFDAANDYDFSAAHRDYPDDTIYRRRLRMYERESDASWRLNFGHEDFTLDKRLLGFAADEDSVVAPENHEIISPYSYAGAWQAPVSAFDKRRYCKKSSFFFGEDAKTSGIYTSSARYDVRKFHYRFVPSPHVFDYHALDSARAADAGLKEGDVHNIFEDLWKHATDGPIIVQHHTDMPIGMNIRTPWELCRWEDTNTLEDFNRVVSEENDHHGEVYEIEFEMAVLISNYTH